MPQITVPDSIKMIRETLCLAQAAFSLAFANDTTHHRLRLQRMIDDCDRQRPLQSNGKHGDHLHTKTCGCEDKPSGLIHFAGLEIQVGLVLRQRCDWCGELLIDYDLARIAVPVGQDSRPATWPTGTLVLVDGNVSYTVDHKDGEKLPPGTCSA